MEGSMPSSRQEWMEYSSGRQDSVDSNLEELQIDIEIINNELAWLITTDTEAAARYAKDAERYLNAQWQHGGDVFFVSGQWYEPQGCIADDTVQSRHIKKSAAHIVMSNGFVVKPMIDEAGVPHAWIGLSFLCHSQQFATSSMQGDVHLLAFAHPDEISMHYLRPGEMTVMSADLEQIIDTIARVDDRMRTELDDANARFYTLDVHDQTDALYAFTDPVNEVMPAPESLERLLITQSTTPLVYMPNSDGGLTRFMSQDERRAHITGVVEGATVLSLFETGGRERQYKSPDELSTARHGLCLIIRPLRRNIRIPDYSGQPLIVPFRAFEDVSFDLSHLSRINQQLGKS